MRTLLQSHCVGILPNHILKKHYTNMDISQKDLDEWLDDYNKAEYIKVRFAIAERRWKLYSIENFFGMENFKPNLIYRHSKNSVTVRSDLS